MLLIWHYNAVEDLAGIRDYIANDNPTAATRVAARIRTGLLTLTDYPRMGRPGRVPETREFVFADIPYIAVYHIDEDRRTLEILHIIHTAQFYPRE